MYKEVFAGEKKPGQTALSPEVILCYDETKKYAQPSSTFRCSLERPHPPSAGTTKSQRWVGTRKRPKKKPELAIVR